MVYFDLLSSGFSSSEELDKAFRSENARVLYITSRNEGNIFSITKISQKLKVLTITGGWLNVWIRGFS